jgi:hypothetical protein
MGRSITLIPEAQEEAIPSATLFFPNADLGKKYLSIVTGVES